MLRTQLPRTNGRRVAPAPADSGRLRRALCIALITSLASCGGCSRPFWRSQADFDAYNLLFEKTADARWDVPRLTLESDPRSRIFDPFDPDLAPLPPDDLTANQYMHWVHGMRGYKSWHKFGAALSVENPQWLEQFDLAPEDFQVDWLPDAADAAEPSANPWAHTIRNLTLEQAIELANINSREYQQQLENVYLSALALTFARFQFNVRYLGLSGTEPTAGLNYINQPSTLDRLEYNKKFGVSQLLPTGGQWAAELANNTIWLFSTPGQTNSASVLSYSIVQPLLAGAGRKVVLENLTLNERQVLYNIRTLARFRKIFFANTVVNDSSSGGYLGVLRQIQQVENQRSNLRELNIQINKLRAINSKPPKTVRESLAAWPFGLEIPDEFADRLSYDADNRQLIWQGVLNDADVERLLALSNDPEFQEAVRSLGAAYRLEVITLDLAQLLNRQATSQNTLRSAEANLLDNIDEFKLQLGLPTSFQISLERSLLKPFELIDPRLDGVEDRLQDIITQWGDINDDDPAADQLQAVCDSLAGLHRDLLRDGLELVGQDLAREEANRPSRMSRLSSEKTRQQVQRNGERDRLLFRRNQEDLEALGQGLAILQSRITELELTPAERAKILGLFRDVREELLQIAQRLKVVQIGVRSELITLPAFEMALEHAVFFALENRLDLMNARAQVMDARRAMEVAANRMEGVLNVVTRGDIRNTGGHDPFDFRADQSTFQAGLQFTAPLDQVLVRNNYRASQVAYQQARRNYMALEDNVKLSVREAWRQLFVLSNNFETSRQNLRYAAIQLDLAVENAALPVAAGQAPIPQVGQAARGTGTGNQGLNLLNALQTILNAQNDLINIWVEYERNRINIHRDLDIMEIDERGLWRDAAYVPASGIAPALLSEPADVVPPQPAAGVFRIDDRFSAAQPDTASVRLAPAARNPAGNARTERSGVVRLVRGTERRDGLAPGDRRLFRPVFR